MDLLNFKRALERLENSLENLDKPSAQPKSLFLRKFKEKSQYSRFLRAQNQLKQIVSLSWGFLPSNLSDAEKKMVVEVITLADKIEELYIKKKFDELKVVLDRLKSLAEKFRPEEKIVNPRFLKIPADVRPEILADFEEIDSCYKNGCYRSVVILCGRVLELALHRKYYEITERDILEKNPGIGLGTLVAKLKDKDVNFDPGVTQQIHLINQVRIYSVHKKQTPFYPTKNQAYAMILFTVDTLNKLF